MASYTRKLKDASGNYIIPATRSVSVYMENNQTLEDFIEAIQINLQQSLDKMQEKIDESSFSLLDAYPVGSIYQSTSSTSPASLFGGSWTAIQDRFLYGSGTKSVGDSGGEETHKLTTTEIPAHTHGSKTLTGQGPEVYASKNVNCSGIVTQTITVNNREYTQNGGVSNRWLKFSIKATHEHSSVGGNGAHNNMPPYEVVNIWKRTA